MRSNNSTKKKTILRLTMVILVLIIIGLLVFKDEIKKHKVTQAKIEMLKRMYTSPPKQWDDEFKEVLDSLIIESHDSVLLGK